MGRSWYDEIEHVTVCSSIPKELLPAMEIAKGTTTKSKYIRRLIEADVASKGIQVSADGDAESVA